MPINQNLDQNIISKLKNFNLNNKSNNNALIEYYESFNTNSTIPIDNSIINKDSINFHSFNYDFNKSKNEFANSFSKISNNKKCKSNINEGNITKIRKLPKAIISIFGFNFKKF